LHVAPHNLFAMLNEHCPAGILENNVILWIAALEFVGNFGIEIILLVFCFPVAERNSEGVKQRAVNGSTFFGRCLERIFRHERQVERTAPYLQQILEGFTQHRFCRCTRYFTNVAIVLEAILNLAHDMRLEPG
jgi:hypothetical protein